jgi:glycosidase
MRTLILSLLAALLLLPGCTTTETPDAGIEVDASARASDVILYQIFVRDFTPEGTFQAMIPKLPELRDLGVNTLWLMPIHPIGELNRKGTLGSPYSIRDFYAVDPNMGTADDFRELVAAIHNHGMRIILDLVANHSAWDNAWAETNPDFYVRNERGEMVPPVDDWWDVADLDYDNPAVRAEMRRVMRFWVEEFGIDGYRCDVAEMVPLEFWREAIAELRTIKPVLMLAEGAAPELYDAGFDITYAWDPYRSLIEVWNGADVGSYASLLMDEQLRYGNALRLRFTTNHDETAWDAPPVELFNGLAGARAASVATKLLPGIPLVYNGQEVGSGTVLRLFEKDDIDFTQNPEMRAFYRDLLAIASEPSFRRGSMDILEGGGSDVFLMQREYSGDRVVVAVNVRDRPSRANSGLSIQEVLFDSGDVSIEGSEMSLPPYGFIVFRPEQGPN